MQDQIGQTSQPRQAGRVVEVGEQRPSPGGTPGGGPAGIAQQGVDAVALGKAGENAAGHVPAANDQDFLHAGIVAEQ